MDLSSFEHLSVTTGSVSGMDTPSSSTRTESHPTPSMENFLPRVVAAQTPGQVMEVMRTSRIDKNRMWVYAGDRVEILGYPEPGVEREDIVRVRHVTRKVEFSMSWHCLLPYGIREWCPCPGYKCRCVYEDFEKSQAFAEHSAEKGGGKHHSFEKKISDPATLEGQTPGALLIVKQNPGTGFKGYNHWLQVEIGDIVELKGSAGGRWGMINAKNIRTGQVCELLWKSVFSVNKRSICDCNKWVLKDEKKQLHWSHDCTCVYDDFQASKEYISLIGPPHKD